MTSPNIVPQVPVLAPEVEAKTQDGIYMIESPKITPYQMPYINNQTVPSVQLRCQSLYAKRPNEISCCNSVVKTIIGQGSGDQTEIIECGKCRTAYLVRTRYTENGDLQVKATIWDTGRNIKPFCKIKRDKDYNTWVEFNKK